MKIRKIKGLSALSVFFAVAFGVLVIFCPQATLEGMRSGLEMCVNVVVPSLFPFLAVSTFIAKSSALQNLSKVTSPVMRLFFRLPGEAAAAVVFGLIGGFPVGCSVAAQLYEQGRLTAEQAQRITLFCINAGPAFTVTAVGTVMLGSSRAGAILFASLCISALLIGFALRFTAPMPEKKDAIQVKSLPPSVILVEAAERSAYSMMKICVWVTLFSCMFSLVGTLGLSETAMAALRCVFEVTGGSRAAADTGNIFTVAATLGWSGLCVICQVLGDVRKVGTPLPLLLTFRAVHAGLAAVVCFLLLKIFPIELSVFSSFSGKTSQELFSASAPAAAALMCLCAVFVIDLDRNKKVC